MITSPSDDGYFDTPSSDELRGESTRAMLTCCFEGWQITPVRIAAHVVPYLVGNDHSCIATLGADIDCGSGYMLDGQIPSGYLRDGGPDYFVASGRDNGYSAGWGFAARAGGIFVSIQITIGHWQKDPTRYASKVFTAFNEHLAPLMDRGRRPTSVGVLFSEFRRERSAFTLGERPDAPTWDRYTLDEGWSIAVAHDHDGELAVGSLRPHRNDSEELRAALAFLQTASPDD